MPSLRNLYTQIGNPLEWPAARKAHMLLWICIMNQSWYLTFYLVVLGSDRFDAYVNTAQQHTQLPVLAGILAINLALILALRAVRHRWSDCALYEHIAAQYFGLMNVYYGYQIGLMSLPVGVVLVGAPVVGFIFFNYRAVVGAFASSVSALTALSLLTVSHLLPYAPIARHLHDTDGQLAVFWTACYCLFAAPHLFSIFGIVFYLLQRWRQREEAVLALSRTDALTGLMNRRSILQQIAAKRANSARSGQPMAVVMVDLDHFKTINDTWGHDMGDAALVAVSAALQDAVRKHDYVGRYGGEEFLVLLADLDREHAKYLAERIRSAIAGISLSCADGSSLHLSASLGMSFYTLDANMSVEDLIRRADQALYRAKHAGRDRLEIAA